MNNTDIEQEVIKEGIRRYQSAIQPGYGHPLSIAANKEFQAWLDCYAFVLEYSQQMSSESMKQVKVLQVDENGIAKWV